MVIGRQIIASKLVPYLRGLACDALFVLIDEALEPHHGEALGLLRGLTSEERVLSHRGGEEVKSLSALEELWLWLQRGGASRSSLLLVVGGGSLTDLGALAAATYMRGLRHILLPTTLLGMVDAAIGGKAAIDLAGVKNLVGAFHPPLEVFTDLAFLDSLPLEALYSGYAEVIKYGMISGEALWRQILRFGDPETLTEDEWLGLIAQCARCKEDIVAQDPEEISGLRRILNLGHTVGHALEAYSLSSPKHRSLSHGEAVIIGLIVETYIGVQQLGGSSALLRQLVQLSRELYPQWHYVCRDYPALLALMRQDKKSSRGDIVMMVALEPGNIQELRLSTEDEIKEGLDFYRETFGG